MTRVLRFGKLLPVLSLLAVLGMANSALALDYWWDLNGPLTTDYAGTGNWDSSISSNWSTDPTGASTTAAVTTSASDDVYFATPYPTGRPDITVLNTQSANSIHFGFSPNQAVFVHDDPGIRLVGGTINLGGGTNPSGIFVGAAPVGTSTSGYVYTVALRGTNISLQSDATIQNDGLNTLHFKKGGSITGSYNLTFKNQPPATLSTGVAVTILQFDEEGGAFL